MQAEFASQWIAAIQKKDVSTFMQSLNEQGVFAVRYFNSGGNGKRGSNIKRIYKTDEINKLDFPVPKETPINVASAIFELDATETLTTKKLDSTKTFCEATSKSDSCLRNLEFSAITDKLEKIACESSCEQALRLISMGDESFMLTDIAKIDGILTGGAAIFYPHDGQYKLTSLIDIR